MLVNLTKGSKAWSVIADSTPEIVFFVEHDYSCVPDTFDILSDKPSRKLGGHTIG
jgi:hypothetical protein